MVLSDFETLGLAQIPIKSLFANIQEIPENVHCLEQLTQLELLSLQVTVAQIFQLDGLLKNKTLEKVSVDFMRLGLTTPSELREALRIMSKRHLRDLSIRVCSFHMPSPVLTDEALEQLYLADLRTFDCVADSTVRSKEIKLTGEGFGFAFAEKKILGNHVLEKLKFLTNNVERAPVEESKDMFPFYEPQELGNNFVGESREAFVLELPTLSTQGLLEICRIESLTQLQFNMSYKAAAALTHLGRLTRLESLTVEIFEECTSALEKPTWLQTLPASLTFLGVCYTPCRQWLRVRPTAGLIQSVGKNKIYRSYAECLPLIGHLTKLKSLMCRMGGIITAQSLLPLASLPIESIIFEFSLSSLCFGFEQSIQMVDTMKEFSSLTHLAIQHVTEFTLDETRQFFYGTPLSNQNCLVRAFSRMVVTALPIDAPNFFTRDLTFDGDFSARVLMFFIYTRAKRSKRPLPPITASVHV